MIKSSEKREIWSMNNDDQKNGSTTRSLSMTAVSELPMTPKKLRLFAKNSLSMLYD